MVSCTVLVLGPLWIQALLQVCRTEKLPRGAVVSWIRERVLESLGLLEPPSLSEQRPKPEVRVPRTKRALRVSREPGPDQDRSEMILFPSRAAISCTTVTTLSYRFQPSIATLDAAVTSAHFWFHAGTGANASSSSSLFIVTSAQRRLQATQAPPTFSSDGWSTYDLDQGVLAPLAEGPFLLQIQSSAHQHLLDNPEKTPFLHLHVRCRAPVRSPRAAPISIPWSPSALHLLQRPSARHGDCHREQVEVSFKELGWDSWIVHPKALAFSYCHGNCSAAMLGMGQCCIPVPGTMRSLMVTTTSDGGYSYKYETLPNIMPEECTCI